MRDIKRIDRIMAKLTELWKSSPDVRFGQLTYILHQQSEIDPFYLEDDKWLEIIESYIKTYNTKDKSGRCH